MARSALGSEWTTPLATWRMRGPVHLDHAPAHVLEAGVDPHHPHRRPPALDAAPAESGGPVTGPPRLARSGNGGQPGRPTAAPHRLAAIAARRRPSRSGSDIRAGRAPRRRPAARRSDAADRMSAHAPIALWGLRGHPLCARHPGNTPLTRPHPDRIMTTLAAAAHSQRHRHALERPPRRPGRAGSCAPPRLERRPGHPRDAVAPLGPRARRHRPLPRRHRGDRDPPAPLSA